MDKRGKTYRPIVELRGVGFVNKGAELMLLAILEKVRHQWPDAIFVMETSAKISRTKLLGLGIYAKTKLSARGINMKPYLNCMPRAIRRRLYLIRENEIDLILDGSGFAFGDFWGPSKAADRMADHIEKWKKQGVKVVLLPQAMGPFRNSALRAKMEVILNNATLIFVRDKYSLKHIRDIPAEQSHIHLMPDFTNLLEGKLPGYFRDGESKIGIIPNSKVIQSGMLEKKVYMTLLNKIIEDIKAGGDTPYFLIHAGEEDFLLAKEVNKSYSKRIKIIKEEDPVYIKGIIGNSKGIITSRFHGLVSALSQAIPCLAFGWSHKYKALMEDYNYPEGLIEKKDLSDNRLPEKIGWLISEDSRTRIHENLLTASKEQKEQTEKMWNMVFKLFLNE